MLTVMRIDRWDSRRDGPVTEAALRRKMETIGYQVCKCAWPGGTIVPPQTQDKERVDAVVTGIVKITLDGESAILTAGDIVYVPRGAVRTVEVVGAHTAHCLDATYCQWPVLAEH
jgi:mannose-6-phosphate isomerase-like protein (cupin superfamily)